MPHVSWNTVLHYRPVGGGPGDGVAVGGPVVGGLSGERPRGGGGSVEVGGTLGRRSASCSSTAPTCGSGNGGERVCMRVGVSERVCAAEHCTGQGSAPHSNR
jgi:hypothetical protein